VAQADAANRNVAQPGQRHGNALGIHGAGDRSKLRAVEPTHAEHHLVDLIAVHQMRKVVDGTQRHVGHDLRDVVVQPIDHEADHVIVVPAIRAERRPHGHGLSGAAGHDDTAVGRARTPPGSKTVMQ